MRILADENFPQPLVGALRSQDHDVVWARTDCPGAKDKALIERAESEGRLLFTLDKDFWQLALQRPTGLRRCGVVLFRCHPATAERLAPLVESALRSEHSWTGRVGIVSPAGIEVIQSVRRP